MKPIDQYHQRVREALRCYKQPRMVYQNPDGTTSAVKTLTTSKAQAAIDQATHDLFVALIPKSADIPAEIKVNQDNGIDRLTINFARAESEGYNLALGKIRQAIKPLGGEK